MRMNSRIQLVFLLFIFSFNLYSQDHIQLRGQVIDAKTHEPLPYAHIGISNTSIGVISNASGFFALSVPSQFYDRSISITSIGYKKREIKIAKTAHNRTIIELQEDITQLNEVVITKDKERDVALELVKDAIRNIEKNYPHKPEILRGFSREIITYKNKTEYAIESILDIYKESYEKSRNSGTVRVEEARKYESNEEHEKSGALFYASGHTAHSFDFVIRREGPLEMRRIDAYQFKITDTLQYQNKPTIRISFQSKKGETTSGQGVLYITLDTKAFVRGEFFYNVEEVALIEKIGSVINGYKRMSKQYITEYKEQDGAWHLNSLQYKTNFISPSKDTLKLQDILVITDIKKHPDKIPYIEQLQYHDVLLENTGEYEVVFWENYKIPVPDQQISALFNTTLSKQKEEHRKTGLRDFAVKTKASFSFFATSAKVLPMVVNYWNMGFRVNNDLKQHSYYYFGLNSSLEYEFMPQLFLGLETRETFGKNRHSTFALKVGWQKNLNSTGRPIYISPSINMGYYIYGYFLNHFKNDGEFSVKGKTFDSGSIAVSLESRRLSVEPLLRLSWEKSRRTSFFTEAGWAFALKAWDGIYIKERSGGIFNKKSSFISTSDPHLFFSKEDVKINKIAINSFFTVNLGIMVRP